MGVKSLWSLLTPVGRPIFLETVEGKIMAIDSSIWIYQFQATMRDKDGRALLNAHVLGFLRRISKLLFYGIKPVFVFDGGAPVLKRTTLRERRQKRSGAAADHAKLAEKLLAAQMRREALGKVHPEKSTTALKGKAKILDEQTVYLEDVDRDPSRPETHARTEIVSSLSLKKNKFYDHDPYRLPDMDIEKAAVDAVQSVTPDPRLATEEELRAFIDEMRPEDFDVTSPAFRELPTEVQYEIVGDLRLKSRQTSYARLQNMLKSAPTPLDFSKQQIRNLRQRNTLTQQLLITTDSIGSAHISIPVRIAGERNKEYVLMKNQSESGGWILGIRDDGTKLKPIEIDQDEERPELNEDSDEDMEEVPISTHNIFDPDLRRHQQNMALSAIANRSEKPLPLPRASTSSANPDTSVESDDQLTQPLFYDSDEDEELALAIQSSLMDAHSKKVTPVDQLSRGTSGLSPPFISTNHFTKRLTDPPLPPSGSQELISPNRLETALSIANTSPSKSWNYSSLPTTNSKSFGHPLLLSSQTSLVAPSEYMGRSDDTHPSTPVGPNRHIVLPVSASSAHPNDSTGPTTEQTDAQLNVGSVTFPSGAFQRAPYVHIDSGDSLEEVPVTSGTFPEAFPISRTSIPVPRPPTPQPSDTDLRPSLSPLADENLEGPIIHWSRSPSPNDLSSAYAGFLPSTDSAEDEEMDPVRERSEFAQFISEVKGKDIEDARREIDDEIKLLNQQRKAAMRDSEDITQQMISQIMTMLRLFGIPYITAPMEAEAQCAELVSLGLVDGVITDDSDVFLFGAQRVFKNMFNQSKTVECFLLSDLSRELGLERDTLIRLAYLLGSDYVDGLSGVGPVVAMELLKEFPGEDGLHKFKDWWARIQTGKDKEGDSDSKFKKQFKKKFKNLYLPPDWPNPAVKDAYYHPTVDSSDEPFKWGIPDLDALRGFLLEELGWGQGKVDEVLLPIIQKMNKRREATALNKQSNLSGYFDVTAGIGSYAPRKRQAYASKRLQKVVNDFRSKRKRSISSMSPSSHSESENEPQKKRKPRTNKTKGRAQVNTARQVMGGRGAHGGNIPIRSKKTASPSENEFEIPTMSQQETADTLLNLGTDRPKPRPKPAYRETRWADDDTLSTRFP